MYDREQHQADTGQRDCGKARAAITCKRCMPAQTRLPVPHVDANVRYATADADS